jgi:transcriptional regulator NrdR family protein
MPARARKHLPAWHTPACPECSSTCAIVRWLDVVSKRHAGLIVRHRECRSCGARWETIQAAERVQRLERRATT